MKLLLLSFLIGVLLSCNSGPKRAHAGYNFNGSFVTFAGDSFPCVKWIIDSGDLEVSGGKDLLIRRASWIIDSLLDDRHKDTIILSRIINYEWEKSNGIWYAHQLGDSIHNGEMVIYEIPMRYVVGLKTLPEVTVIVNNDTVHFCEADTPIFKSRTTISLQYSKYQ